MAKQSLKKNIFVPGFQFAGIHCGIKDNLRKKDLALIYSEEEDTLVDGVFTKNKIVAAPVTVCKQSIKKGYGRLIVINSGVANACTGERGLKDARKTQSTAAKIFGISKEEVLVCSTGKIGEYIPMNFLLSGIEKAKEDLGEKYFMDAVRGIMTTDQYPKYDYIKDTIDGTPYTIAVLAKGAGMLRPDMATMLAYVVTDLKFSRDALKIIFRNAVNTTLNRITVDGDMSTNDTVLIMANGRAKNETFEANSVNGKKVEKNLHILLEAMARKIALDGEGATKCCEVYINGAKNQDDAKKVAYAIGNSPLVKTALFGCDPNWGRIVAAIGYSGAKINPNKLTVKIGETLVFKDGGGVEFNPKQVSRYMENELMTIHVDLFQGTGKFHVYMSDLTYDYVNLNAEYHT